MKRNRKLILTAFLLAAALPIAAIALFKPLRILVPQLNGVTCIGAICVDDLSAFSAAERLHAEAMANVAAKLRPLTSPPRAVFCSSSACYDSFGGGGRGITVFRFGVVIPPESWQTYIVEHELIHMLQAQELGLRGRERTPPWFKEGMPFFISAPPAFDLPDYAKPLVAEYAAWEQRVGRDNVWAEIGSR